MILGASGENVYPDELEELYRDSRLRQGVCRSSGCRPRAASETVAALVVPDYEDQRRSRGGARARARALQEGRQELPLYKRVKVVPPVGPRSAEDVDAQGEAPRGRRGAAELERAAKGGAEAKQLATAAPAATTWIHDVLADVVAEEARHDHGATRARGARLRLADVHRARGRARGGRRQPAGSGAS